MSRTRMSEEDNEVEETTESKRQRSEQKKLSERGLVRENFYHIGKEQNLKAQKFQVTGTGERVRTEFQILKDSSERLKRSSGLDDRQN